MGAPRFTLAFGALSAPILEQLAAQGLSLVDRAVGHVERDAEAISRLHVRGLLTGREADAARRRLIRKIGAAAFPTSLPTPSTETGGRDGR